MGEVQLFGAFPSPFSSRVEWTLLHKGITYEYIEEDLQNKSALLLKYNPVYKKIPLLLHGGKPITESLVILEYINDIWKEHPLLPQDPFERAKARFWAKFADGKCAFSIWTAFRTEGKEQEKAVEASLEALKALDEEVKGKDFFGGENIGLVDIAVGWIPHWLPVLDEVTGLKLLDAAAFPSLQTWGHRFLNIPFIKEKLPPSDRMVSHFTTARKGILNK